MTRKSNRQLVVEFRALLTDGARERFDDAELELTRAYRADLWRAFNAIEERLDPLLAVIRERNGSVGNG